MEIVMQTAQIEPKLFQLNILFKRKIINFMSKIRSKLTLMSNLFVNFTRPKVAVHGIQRSGTNYLCQYLFRSGVGVVNFPDPARNNPRHKHFRWYSNKHAIPAVIRKQFGNKSTVDSLANLNKICRYDPETFHFVVIKDKQKWILSILNWGISCKWFDSVDDAIENVPEFLKDYNYYYEFWRSLERGCPERIRLVSIESIMEDTESFNLFLAKICGLKSVPKFKGIFKKLPQSPINRCQYFADEDIETIKSVLNKDPY